MKLPGVASRMSRAVKSTLAALRNASTTLSAVSAGSSVTLMGIPCPRDARITGSCEMPESPPLRTAFAAPPPPDLPSDATTSSKAAWISGLARLFVILMSGRISSALRKYLAAASRCLNPVSSTTPRCRLVRAVIGC